ncbi:MAG TPA: hypothetical protein VEB64_10040 [Azospirillaceae bacterium]|nr:hypothetical protein [Azospirillaceae bacterium]
MIPLTGEFPSSRLTDRISLGVLARAVPARLIDERCWKKPIARASVIAC